MNVPALAAEAQASLLRAFQPIFAAEAAAAERDNAAAAARQAHVCATDFDADGNEELNMGVPAEAEGIGSGQRWRATLVQPGLGTAGAAGRY